ncbi:MAG: flagellar hook protein FlgE [Hyphomicrobiales bacterium]
MSLFGMMRTGVSGMSAQANKLSTVSDNISNSDTTGYKRATTEFSTLLGNSSPSAYTSGGVNTNVRYGVTAQGNIQGTTSATDLAINGNGFFLVNNAGGTPFLTRAGSFVPDASGNLVNAAGFFLMGYDLSTGSGTGVANGLTGLQKVNVSQTALQATPSTAGTFSANLPAAATVVTTAANLPSANNASATPTDKTSLVTYDNLGNAVTLDVYFTKTGTGPDTWEAAVYNQAGAAAGGGFPYSNPPLATQTLTFSATGNLTSGSPVSIPIPNGQNFALDLSKTTQLGTGYTVIGANANGNAPSPLDHVAIANDGTLSFVYQNGISVPAFKIPLATVASPDNLTPESGNVYSPNIDSGEVVVGAANSGGFGAIDSSSLEQSTVDLATELTAMIEAQRGYTANSKVFQTGADLMDVVVNLRSQ